ncbi:MAG: aminotransferase class I/II-fold pyridoxal phosphate-dependent enzyme [Candidatus Competibacteraceae bacterium]
MLDFTSALYLGLLHPSHSLRPWTRLTTGVPAALATPFSRWRLTQTLAELQGCEQATLGASTLHLFWDLFSLLADDGVAIYLDAGTYPIGQWGVERAAARGVPVRRFPHHDVRALDRLLQQDAGRGLRPVVVADGFCPGCDGPAPVVAYLDSVRTFNGYLILDDTQALGILGHTPGLQAPYGTGGGGMLQWSGAGGPEVITISSLAKGFGVPVAVLAGSTARVQWFEAHSETQVHCSPPSVAVIHAAERALAINQEQGDALRLHLAGLVRRFRQGLRKAGLSTTGKLFPVQTLTPVSGLDARLLYRRLLQHGIRTVLHKARDNHGPRISFLITALHRPVTVDKAVDVVRYLVHGYAKSQPTTAGSLGKLGNLSMGGQR